MTFQVEQTSDVVRTASVHILQDTYEAGVNKALRKLSGRVKVPGFRKGKIPMSVMKQRYGQSVQTEVLDDLLNKSITEIVDELKTVLYVSQPKIESFPLGGGQDFKFSVEIEVRPPIDPVGYKGVKVDRPAITVDEKDIDVELEGIRRGYAKNSVIEGRKKVKKGDLVTFSFQAAGDDPDLADFAGDNAQVRVGDGQAMKGIEEALEGAKFDSEVVASVLADEKFAIEELRGKNFDVKLKIEKVEEQVMPELDDQFAKDTGRAETIDALREVIRGSLAHRQEHDARHFAEDGLVEHLLGKHKFDLPPRYVDQELEAAVRQQLQQMGQKLDDEQTQMMVQMMKETVRVEREKQIRTEFLLLAIADKETINVDNDDLKKTIEHQAAHMNVEAVRLMRFLNENKNGLYQMMTTARLEKTLGWLIAESTINNISWEEARARTEKAEASAKAEMEAQAPKAPKAVKAEKAEKAEKPKKAAKAAKAEPAEAAPAEAAPAKAKKAAKKSFDADAAREALSAMSAADLKELCKANDLKVSGKKEELVERLVEGEITA
jgi:trigger factor